MSTYAIIASGGKQYRVAAEKTITVEYIDAAIGDKVKLDDVLFVADENSITTDAKSLAASSVEAEVVAQGRHKKVKILKFKRRKHHMKQQGHRQYFTKLMIRSIKHGS